MESEAGAPKLSPLPAAIHTLSLGAAAHRFATSTIEGSLAAVRRLHLDKGRGKLASTNDDYDVKE